ncbi:basic salivary proline-rich protein 3-like [Anthonomus grandis grandis]|uniref:basic salivary proline-rich protein 3-like n=1 Tax=Anthonomus grandis grandis TaxID=2921223 RepID=UPI0021651E9F|nr:basic salivary proline-rich protein 3-like [Anthonomus grandis grandis]
MVLPSPWASDGSSEVCQFSWDLPENFVFSLGGRRSSLGGCEGNPPPRELHLLLVRREDEAPWELGNPPPRELRHPCLGSSKFPGSSEREGRPSLLLRGKRSPLPGTGGGRLGEGNGEGRREQGEGGGPEKGGGGGEGSPEKGQGRGGKPREGAGKRRGKYIYVIYAIPSPFPPLPPPPLPCPSSGLPSSSLPLPPFPGLPPSLPLLPPPFPISLPQSTPSCSGERGPFPPEEEKVSPPFHCSQGTSTIPSRDAEVLWEGGFLTPRELRLLFLRGEDEVLWEGGYPRNPPGNFVFPLKKRRSSPGGPKRTDKPQTNHRTPTD